MKPILVLGWASLGAEAGLSLAFYRDLKAAKGRETAAGFAYCHAPGHRASGATVVRWGLTWP